ncbi:uncharacterized protein LOC129804905 [Phlebotomus papatasi]|uniref:uncharacterized protein LOC129804905 n=1 Tax=Phlebotomus papatasi TaxID=29031 RepID=UPI00248402E2|nr:uncharacterized protein LOC129804905 [Phlebotomus papatasi]
MNKKKSSGSFCFGIYLKKNSEKSIRILKKMWSVYKIHEKDIYFNEIEYLVSDLEEENVQPSNSEFREAMRSFQGQLSERESNMTLENNPEFCEFVICGTKKVLKIFHEHFAAEYPSGRDFVLYQRYCKGADLLKKLMSDAQFHLELHEREAVLAELGSRRRRYHVHPILQDRDEFGFWNRFVPELKKYPQKFKLFTRMSIKQFDFLSKKIRSRIAKSESHRVPIPPDARLMITLRYLATGDSFPTLSNEYLTGISTISGIVNEVCEAIWEVFAPKYIFWPKDLDNIAEKFEVLHKFPHCCGAVDGKHVRIQKPSQSGGVYYNFKGYHSIVLLGICDAECNFIFVSIGSYGSQSDSSVFNYSEIGRAINNKEICWPTPKNLPNSTIPYNYFIIGDEAFPLSENLLRPYSGQNLPVDKENFNKRLSIARNTIERTFGILSNRFRILRGEIRTLPKHAESFVKACVTLHNYIQKTSDINTPQVRQCEAQDEMVSNPASYRGRQATIGIEKRNIYKDYLYSQLN